MPRHATAIAVAFLLALLPTAPLQAQQPAPTDSAASHSLLADSLQAALDSLEAASPPTARDSARLRQWADSLSAKGKSLRRNNPSDARSLLQKALGGHSALADSGRIASTIGEIGITHYNQFQLEKALAHYREELTISQDIGDRQGVADALQHIGNVHLRKGRFDKALNHYRASLERQREIGDWGRIANTVNNIGAIQRMQGRYDQSLAHFQEALENYRKVDNQMGIARVLGNIGILHKNQGRYESALSHVRESQKINREIGNRRDIAIGLDVIGDILTIQGKYGRALTRYRKSLEMKRETGDQRGVAGSLISIGVVHAHQGHYEEALNTYRDGVTISREIGSRRLTATSLLYIGEAHLQKGHHTTATDTLNRAVRLTEQLRTNATSPEARRSLLSRQINTYRALTTAHVRSGRPDSALRSVEQARARLLADRLAGTAEGDTSFSIPSVEKLRSTLDSGEAALLYANADTDQPLTAIVVTGEETYARELPDSTIRATIETAYPTQLNRLRRTEGPLTAALGDEASKDAGSVPSLAETIRLYRHHLTRQQADASVRRDLARRFYDLLIEPVERQIADADELIVVPTGALGYLPFETLQDSAHQYLVEGHHVRYAQSLTVRRQLQQRDYAGRKKPLFAVGGATYEPNPQGESGALVAEARGGSTHVATGEHASTILRSTRARMEQGKSPRLTYRQLGYRTWTDLPGTEEEVTEISSIMGPSSTVVTGPAASEDTVRSLSESGRLAEHRYVHFATHGVAVPETPALSALVLSQVGASDSLAARDGYLTMEEIADLEIEADVAVLSACQTGLGKVVAGEGVVSLSHAFLRAGANATLVSQWKVLDASTRQFMTAVYERANDESTSFAEAVTETKRAFISGKHGEKNTDPLRWAPFVYYGRV